MSYYITFTYNNLVYALPTIAVQEILFLPEITPIPDAPSDIIGAVNVRGNILPVMDLNLRFGYQEIDYSLTDNIIILNWQEIRLGILTNQVHAIKEIEDQTITTELSHAHSFIDLKQEKFIQGFAQQEETLVIFLNLETLLRYTESQELFLDLDLESLESETEDSEKLNPPKTTVFFPKATPYERQILQKRADNLRQSFKLKDLTGLKPVSIFTLNQELFGVELSLIQEFIKFKKITPIPCTPDFIIGNINLRGEIITLIDIRGLLNLAQPTYKKEGQAIIVNIEGIIVGIIIDSIETIFMLNPQELIDASNRETEINKHYLQGVIPYQEKILSLIDLTEIVLGGNLLVDEAV